MQTINNSTMGFEVPVVMPSTVEEFNKMAGSETAALDGANQQYLQHSWNSDFRRNFVKRFEEVSGVKRLVDQEKTDKQTPKKDGSKTEIYENELTYFKRALAQLGKDKTEFTALALEVAGNTPVDLTEGSRSGRVSKEFLSAAQGILSKAANGQANIDGVIKKLESANPGLTIAREADGSVKEETLARAIKQNFDRKRREDLAELTGGDAEPAPAADAETEGEEQE